MGCIADAERGFNTLSQRIQIGKGERNEVFTLQHQNAITKKESEGKEVEKTLAAPLRAWRPKLLWLKAQEALFLRTEREPSGLPSLHTLWPVLSLCSEPHVSALSPL